MQFHRQIRVDCTPEALWRCLTEVELLKNWVSNLVDETPNDPTRTQGVGVKSTMKMREGKKIVAYQSEVTEWAPKRRLAIRLSGGSFTKDLVVDVAYELSQDNINTTLLDYDVTVPVRGFWFKLLGPLVRMIAYFAAKKDLSRLQALAPTI